jgi:hypothetical protein
MATATRAVEAMTALAGGQAEAERASVETGVRSLGISSKKGKDSQMFRLGGSRAPRDFEPTRRP